MVNYLDDITKLNDSQRLLLDEMKKRFSSYTEDYMKDDYFLLHWLIARKFNVDNAENMLIQHYRVRKALKMDEEEYKAYKMHPIMEKCYPHGCFKHDKGGRPIVYCTIGGIDNKGVVMNTPSSDIYKAILFMQENRKQSCVEASKQFGKRVEQIIFIVDLKGIGIHSLWKPGLDSFVETSNILEQHTPEIIYKLFVINAPSLFPIFYKFVRPILDVNTAQKIEIYGEDFKEGLLKWINEDQLPVRYGGTALNDTDPAPNLEYMVYASMVTEELYLKKDQYLKFEENQKEIKIKAGSFVQVPVTISEEGKILEWYIKSDSDFSFGVFRTEISSEETSIDKMEMVIPYFKVFTLYVPETGKIMAKVGKYVFHFDNSHSWIARKTVKYVINVNDENLDVVCI